MVQLKCFVTALAFSIAASVSAASAVLDLTPSNFDEIVINSGKPALVEFFAPWCGHCKKLAPIYEELAQSIAQESEKVTIGKVDADEHKTLGKKYGVQGFPTIMWFDGKESQPQKYSGARDLESLRAYVSENAGLSRKSKKEVPSEVVILDDNSFDQAIAGDRNVLVAFTAPWCGHCKKLAPVYESIAHVFSIEPKVLIAKVDAEAPSSKSIVKKHGVSSYPTIVFFPAGSKDSIPFEGARSEAGFVEFLNEKTGTHRLVGGGLDARAGTIEALDMVVDKHVDAEDGLSVGSEEAAKVAAELTDSYAPYYVKVFERVKRDGKMFVAKEMKRIEGILQTTSISRDKRDDLTCRLNVLKKFATKDRIKDEL